jgi:hypothetical protein
MRLHRHRGFQSPTRWFAAANWFFNGHRNKLTLDGSWLRVDDPVGARSGWRARLQWEISL